MIRTYAWCTEKKIIFLDCIAQKWSQNISIKQLCKLANRWPNFSCLLYISLCSIHSVSFIIPCAVYMQSTEMHKPLFSQKGLPRMLRYIKCMCGTVCHECMKCQWLYRVTAYVKSSTGAVEMSPGSDRNPCVSPKSHFTLQQQHCNQKIEADRVSLASVCPLFHLVNIVDSVRVCMYMWKRKRACIDIFQRRDLCVCQVCCALTSLFSLATMCLSFCCSVTCLLSWQYNYVLLHLRWCHTLSSMETKKNNWLIVIWANTDIYRNTWSTHSLWVTQHL